MFCSKSHSPLIYIFPDVLIAIFTIITNIITIIRTLIIRLNVDIIIIIIIRIQMGKINGKQMPCSIAYDQIGVGIEGRYILWEF